MSEPSSPAKDESAVESSSNKPVFVRWILLGVGWLSVGLGVAGIVLPLLPTTPFLLLAAACFYRSSPKFHAWLIHHPRLGKYLVYYLDGKGMPMKAKIYTICLIWVTMLISAFVIIDAMAPKFILPAIGAGVTWYILRLPTLQVSSPKSSVSEPPVSTSSVSEPSVSKLPSTGE